jgi:hypothetical protein
VYGAKFDLNLPAFGQTLREGIFALRVIEANHFAPYRQRNVMKTAKLKLLTASVSLGSGLVIGALQPAWATGNAIENGDFETGDLSGWESSGDAGVLDQNVLDGNWSAFITTAGEGDDPLSGNNAVGDTASFLYSDLAYPAKTYKAVEVSFLVRYKTNESVGPLSFWEDPFHAELVTGQGAVELLTIKTDGISWIDSAFPLTSISTEVKDLETGEKLSLSRPTIPTFVEDELYAYQTHTLKVTSRVPVSKGSCDPARIKFHILDWVDTAVNSAAFIDNVRLKFVSSPLAKPCPPPENGANGVTSFSNGPHVGAK